MGISWKEKLAENIREAVAKTENAYMTSAAEFIEELRAAGVTLHAEDGALRVTKGENCTLTDRQRAQIKARKEELLQALTTGETATPNRMPWVVQDVCIEISLADNGIADFVLAPPVAGMRSSEMPAEMQAAMLDAAPPTFAEKVRGMGGLRVYTLSQWAEAKPKVQEALA